MRPRVSERRFLTVVFTHGLNSSLEYAALLDSLGGDRWIGWEEQPVRS